MAADALVWIISLASIFCVLSRPLGVSEAWWAGGGALLLATTSLVSWTDAAAAVRKGTDVYLFLGGMMMLSELARHEGVFHWAAGLAARGAGGSSPRLFLLLYLTGTVVTTFLSNDATAVVLTPAVLTIVRRLKVDPLPHLLACAFISNAASFVLPISNPANLVLFGPHLPHLATWLGYFLLPSVASITVTFLILRFLLRARIGGSIVPTEGERLSRDGGLALGGLGVAAVALVIASALGWPLGLPTCGAAVLAISSVAVRDRAIVPKVAGGVSWSVLPLVAGLFVIVAALRHAGLLDLIGQGLKGAEQIGGWRANLSVAFGTGLLSNVMNNLPVGLIGATAVQNVALPPACAHALLLGIDLGPNLSVTGSLATVLWLIVLRRDGFRITALQFLVLGAIVMPLSLLAAVLLLR